MMSASTWEDLRRHARFLENEIDTKLAIFGKLSVNIGFRPPLISDTLAVTSSASNKSSRDSSLKQLERTKKDLDELLDNLIRINDHLSDCVSGSKASLSSSSSTGSINHQHTLNRHREILHDYLREFNQIRERVGLRERDDLSPSFCDQPDRSPMSGALYSSSGPMKSDFPTSGGNVESYFLSSPLGNIGATTASANHTLAGSPSAPQSLSNTGLSMPGGISHSSAAPPPPLPPQPGSSALLLNPSQTTGADLGPSHHSTRLLLDEAARYSSTERLLDDRLTSASALHSALRAQRNALRLGQTRLHGLTKQFPAVHRLINRINWRKRRDTLVIAGIIVVCMLILLFYLFG